MKKLFFILIIIQYTLLITNCYAQWITQTSGTTQHLYDVYFINTQTGWASGDNGTIIKTTNGGINWFGQVSGVTFPIYSICFVNTNIGYAVTRIDGYFIKTTNGGNNWFTVFSTTKSFESIFFIDSLKGWAAGIEGSAWIFKTTNGGISWDSLNIAATTARELFFVNAQTGWVCGGGVFKTTDGGNNWIFQFLQSQGDLQSIFFINVNTGWTSNEVYDVYKTTDSGNSWALIDDIPPNTFTHSVFFSSANTGWISGNNGVMYKSTNGGFNWLQQNTNTNSFLQSIKFLTDSVGYSVGGAGRIIFTNTSGVYLKVSNIGGEVPTEFKLSQNYPNPFNPKTVIRFQIVNSSYVKLSIFDILGREISVLVNENLKLGTYEVEWYASAYPSGVYYYTLSTESFTDTKKMVLVK